MKVLERSNVLKGGIGILIGCGLLVMASCGGDDDAPAPTGPLPVTVTVNPATTYQEMVGFGGALAWYSDRVVNSPKKTEIQNLIFNDLGADIIRLKTWYYPDNYPTNTSTANMSDDNSKAMWDVTNQLHQLAKTQNQNVKILLSSWGPPAGLKSNNSSREGTLKKEGDAFLYDEYAGYWENLLDNLPFTPEYLSIQNEPTYANSGWTTSQWSITETSSMPSYTIAVDKVYEKIQGRANQPILIGPESQDIPTFGAFANVLKDKAYIGMLAYHPYNINANTTAAQIEDGLKSIGAFTTKPNIMTEFSDNLSWFNTGLFIHNTLVHANSSGYIYWKLAWATPASGEDAGMISINGSGDYTVTPFYYLMKHFAKHIDAGYKRVEVTSTNQNLNITAFINPAQTKATVIIINNTNGLANIEFEVAGKTISGITADQSKEGDYYKALDNTGEPTIAFPAKTISTVVLDL